jgi:hypothetical protein
MAPHSARFTNLRFVLPGPPAIETLAHPGAHAMPALVRLWDTMLLLYVQLMVVPGTKTKSCRLLLRLTECGSPFHHELSDRHRHHYQLLLAEDPLAFVAINVPSRLSASTIRESLTGQPVK